MRRQTPENFSHIRQYTQTQKESVRSLRGKEAIPGRENAGGEQLLHLRRYDTARLTPSPRWGEVG